MFHLAYDFAHLACKWLYLCATYIDSEPLHFVSKSVEIFHASLFHWSLGNKPTLDLSRYIWKSLAGETSCCNFLPDCYLTWVAPEISKMCNLWGNSLKLGRNHQMLIVCEKTLFGCLEMHYMYVSSCLWFCPFGLQMALSMCYLHWFRTFAFSMEIGWNFSRITVPLVSWE